MNERDTITREERMADLDPQDLSEVIDFSPRAMAERLREPVFLDELIDPETCRKIINGELP